MTAETGCPQLSPTSPQRLLTAGLAVGLAVSALGGAESLPPLPRAPAASFAPSLARPFEQDGKIGGAPVDIVGAAELRRGGSTEAAKALQAVLPMANSPHFGIDDGSAHFDLLTFRGFAPDHTVVLVNGHRRHASALLNVNNTIGRGSVPTSLLSIPLAALDQVEVLREGADTRFASGAIAGVLNLRLREDNTSVAGLFFGRTAEHDGEVKQATMSGGAPLGRNGSLNVTVAWRETDHTDRAEPDTRQQYFGVFTGTTIPAPLAGGVGSGTGAPAAGTTHDPREAAANRTAQEFGDAATRQQSMAVNGRLPVSAESEVYGYGDFLLRRAQSAAFFRRPGDSRVVRALWPDGFMPLLESRIADWSFGAGWRGRSNGWRFDAAVVAGANTISYDATNTNNATLGANSPRAFYAGKLGYSEAVTSIDVGRPVNLGLAKPAEVTAGLEYRRENYWIGAGTDKSWNDGGVLIADGADAGREAPDGAQGFPGFRPADEVDVTRKSGSAHVGLSQDIVARLRLTASARYEKVENLGETTDGKLGARIGLWDGAALRGSVGTAYRQPHLAQQWFSSTATNFIGGLPFENRTFPVANPVAQALGAETLKPEHANTMSAGWAWEASPKFGFEVDFFRTDLRDRLILSSNFLGSAVATFLQSKGVSGATGGRFFSNDAATRTEGFDAAVRSKWEIAPGQTLALRAAYSRSTSKLTRVGPTPPGLAALGVTTPLFDLSEEIRLTRSQPRDNLRLAATWDIGRFSTMLRVMRYGEVETVAFASTTPDQIAALAPGYRVRTVTRVLPVAAGAAGGAAQIGGPTTETGLVQIFDAKWVTDLDFKYRVTDRVTFAVGAANLFDIYPTRNLASRVVNGRVYAGNDNAGTTPYSNVSPFGFNGTFFYSKVDVQF